MSADFSIFEFFGHSGGPLSKKKSKFQKNIFFRKKKQMGLFHLPFSHFQKTIEKNKWAYFTNNFLESFGVIREGALGTACYFKPRRWVSGVDQEERRTRIIDRA